MSISKVNQDTKFSAWKDITNLIIDAVGNNENLNTAEKDSLTESINEVVQTIGDITQLSTSSKDDTVTAINEVFSTIGDISLLDSNFISITDVIAACNSLSNRIGSISTLTTTAKNNLVVAVNELVGKLDTIGDLTTLDTTEKSSVVGSINEVFSLFGDLTTLDTTEKGSVVGSINETVTEIEDTNTRIDSEVGDLTTLDTTEKGSVVGSINEIVQTGLVRSIVPVTNLLSNHGRFSSEVTRTISLFDSTLEQLNPFNAAVLSEGERFINDNSNYGGNGGALGTDMGALMTAIQTAGRIDNRNGYEFYICDAVAGGGTSDPELFNTQNYYPLFDGNDFFIAQIGSTVTFQCWIRLKSASDEATFGGILLGDSTNNVVTEIDGAPAAQQSILAVAGGWVNLRQTTVLTNEFKKFFPSIYANNGDEVQIALPTLYAADVNNGIHVGIV